MSYESRGQDNIDNDNLEREYRLRTQMLANQMMYVSTDFDVSQLADFGTGTISTTSSSTYPTNITGIAMIDEADEDEADDEPEPQPDPNALRLLNHRLLSQARKRQHA